MTGSWIRRLLLAGEAVKADVADAVTEISTSLTINGPPTLDITLLDPKRRLLRHQLLRQRTVAHVDGRGFELAQVNKEGEQLNLSLEGLLIAQLRRRRGYLLSGDVTRSQFAGRLVREISGAKIKADPGDKPKMRFARGKKNDKPGRGESSDAALRRLAEDRDWRYFTVDDTVWFGSDDWLLQQGKPLVLRESDAIVNSADFDWDIGKKAATLTADVWADDWAIPPGAPARWADMGAADGLWLVETITHPLDRDLATVEFTRAEPELPEPKPEPPPSDYGDIENAPGVAGGSVVTGDVTAGGYQWPVSGHVTSEYGMRRHPISGITRLHAGTDIGAGSGTPVRAARDGIVVARGAAGGYGNKVDVRHSDGVVTAYAHLSAFDCYSGQRVARGQQIGRVGMTGSATGPHLHFEVRVGGVARNPRSYLPRR